MVASVRLKPTERDLVRHILNDAVRDTVPEILELEVENPIHKDTESGYIVDPDFTDDCNNIFRQNLRRCARDWKFPLEERVNILLGDKFVHNFKTEKRPALLANVPDGKKALVRHLATVTRRKHSDSNSGRDLIYEIPPSAISAALFEGPKYDDITMSTICRMSRLPHSDIISAIKYNDDLYVAFSRKELLTRDPIWDDSNIGQSRIMMITSTNYNSTGIAQIRDHLQMIKKYDEVRFECKGSTANDFFPIFDNVFDALADFRAEYPRSWATLRLKNAAYLFPIAKSLNWPITTIHGTHHDNYVEGSVLNNRKLSLLLTKNKELHDSLVTELGDQLPGTRDEWAVRRTFSYQPMMSDYTIVRPKIKTTFKVSYVARREKTDQYKFIHILECNEDGKKYLKEDGRSFDKFIKTECRLDSLNDLDSINILKPDEIRIINGKVVMIESVYSKTLDEIYLPGDKLAENSIGDFYNHTEQILDGMKTAHTYSPDDDLQPVLHGDLKLSNIGLSGDTIKIDDWGVSSIIKSLNYLQLRNKAVGTINTRAPEQFRDKVKDTRTDVYSIGAVLFRMLTGFYPVHDYDDIKPLLRSDKRIAYENKIKKFRISNRGYSNRIDKALRHVPTDLSNFVKTMLARDPDKRPQNAEEAYAEFAVVKNRFQTYAEAKIMVNSFQDGSDLERYRKLHLLDTERRLVAKHPEASYALRIAALFHDRDKPNTLGHIIKFDDFKLNHAYRCSEKVGRWMTKATSADRHMVKDATKYIKYHEHKTVPVNIKKDIRYLIDADSESFFHKVYHLFTAVINDQARIQKAVNYMLDKMTDRARDRTLGNNDVYATVFKHLKDEYRRPEKLPRKS